MKRNKKIAIIAGILILLYTLTGFLVIPLIAESVLPDKLSKQLDRQASIENIYFNPYTLTLELEGFEIREKTGNENFIAFDRFLVNLQWSSLFKLSLIGRELRLENPMIRITRVSDTKFNFSDLIPSGKEKTPSPSEEEKNQKPLRFFFSNITLSGGKFVFRDKPMDKTHSFSDINFNIPGLSNFESDINTYSKPMLAGDLNEAQLKVTATTKPFADSLKTIIDISMSGISLPGYFDYVPVPLGFSVSEGKLDINASVSFSKNRQGQSVLEVSGAADFSDLLLTEKNAEEILSIPSINLKMAPSAPLNKKIRIESLTITEPSVTIIRRADGKLNIANLGPPASESRDEKQEEKAEDKDPQKSFIFELDLLELDSGSIRFRDFAAPAVLQNPDAGPVKMQAAPVDLTVSAFSNQPGHQAELDFSAKLNTDALLSVTGAFGVAPLASNIDIKLKDLKLTNAQPYFPESLHLMLSGGRFGLEGNTRFHADAEEGITAHFAGNAGLRDMVLIEEKTGRKLTELKSFEANGIDVAINPTEINLEELSVAGLNQKIAVGQDGRMNLKNIYQKKGEIDKEKEKSGEAAARDKTKDSQEGGKTAFPVSIGEVKLAGINVLFTDYSIKPNYSSNLTLDQGSIKGLSTTAFQGAEARLKGAVNNHAPFTVAGRINPLLEEILLDLDFNMDNLELSPFSPYSGKYIGRAIQKGKLNLELDYMVENSELDAKNHILLDQFSLGQRIESDDALNLPVGLAVALLKDRKGKIDLNLPVSGRLDDPKFSLGGVIFQALKNILVKAATSPFSLVSSIVKGGEELRYIEFNAGSADITDTAAKKIDSIQTLLYERPGLNMEVTGYADQTKDREALAGMVLEEKILEAGSKDKNENKNENKDEKTGETEDAKLSEKEYNKLLRQVYKKEVLSGPDVPEDAKPLSDESLTTEEMRKKILQGITIDDSKLRSLIQKRGKTVIDAILKDERIAAKRLFLKKAKNLSPPEPGKFKKSRVELGLQ
ncbi:MAG: DUF748 domain-containing protein [Desulfobacteraceae bacterium]|nr:DUF748 domain-containing protein [Desulfobacteraceae bacterium]